MRTPSFMLIAGEPSGDALAAELVCALKASPRLEQLPFPPRFFGAGGPKMAAAGVELALDLTEHAVFGLSDVLKHYLKFRRFFGQLYRLALKEKPDFIILVDYAGFNRRFAKAIKRQARSDFGTFSNWNPKIVYYVSPQVWASREGRAYQLARDVDLLLSIFPFEKAWYGKRVPRLRVEYVGHPMLDRFADRPGENLANSGTPSGPTAMPLVLLLPGSRKRELEAHLPLMMEAADLLARRQNFQLEMVVPNEALKTQASLHTSRIPGVTIKVGGLGESLKRARVAIASSGTVTLECAYFGVPTVVVYRTSWITYWIARQIVRVKFIAMPNILADEPIYPELIQNRATPEAIAQHVSELLENQSLRRSMQEKLTGVVDNLGLPGANLRAANAILGLCARCDDLRAGLS